MRRLPRAGQLRPRSQARLGLQGDVETRTLQYRRRVADGSVPASPATDQVRALIPVFALVVAVVAALTDPASPADLILAALPVGAFAAWAYVPRLPLAALSLAVVVPVVIAQRSGQLEPLFFEVSLLAFVVGLWARSLAVAAALGVLAGGSPAVVGLIQDPSEIGVGIWIMGIAFPWILGRAAARQQQLATQLDATRRELAEQALLAERRRIARDVHDFVGHGLAAVMLQITSARHVMRRDPAAAEEALRSAEEVGRRGMQELRRTVALLRGGEEASAAGPLPSGDEIPALVDHARTGGLAVELRTRGDLARIAPSIGAALYRIAQEALANAARHAPQARTVLAIEVGEAQACLVAETTGPTADGSATEPDRPRYGLVGMRERATALGGQFSAAPTAGGWRVSCSLPLQATNEITAGGAGAA
jgi:signal transduction histidine kinase